jgi:hypothetical protein
MFAGARASRTTDDTVGASSCGVEGGVVGFLVSSAIVVVCKEAEGWKVGAEPLADTA